MSNPPGPEVPEPPAYQPPPAAAPPAYGAPAAPAYGAPEAPAYGAPPAPAGGPAYGAPAAGPIPGRTLGIVALIVAFFANLIGLILGIVALVQSRNAGHKNLPAVWAIIVGGVLMLITAIIIIAVSVTAFNEVARLCAEYGTGTHEINGVTVTLNCG
jgi:uncharacterized protein with PQ loop repeat